jgi:hypothetical protein
MKRRQVLAAIGAVSGGSALLTSTSAFTGVSANRDIAVQVAGDADAFLRLGPCGDDSGNAEYVDMSDGQLGIDLSESNADPSGDGVNADALSRFDNVFEVANQGTQDVCVDFAVEVPDIPGPVPDRYDFGAGDPAVVFYRGDRRDDFVIANQLNPDREGAIELPIDSGSVECIGFEVRSFGFDTDTKLFDGVDLTIRADADANCGGQDGTDPADPTPTNPLAHWAFDDGDIDSEPVIDVSGNGNSGTVQNSDGANGVEGVGGDANNAAAFDNEAYVRSNPLEIKGALTVSAWVYPETEQTNGNFKENFGIVSQYPGSSQDNTWIFEIDSELKATQFWDGTDGTNWVRDETDVPKGEWTHVAAVWEKSERREIYVDGDQRVSEDAALEDDMEVDDIPTRIGYSGDYSRYFEGRLDEVRVYDRGLTATEIQNLANEFPEES